MKLCFFSSSSSPPLSSKLSRVSLNTLLPLLVISFFPSIPLFSFFSQSVFPPILSLSSHFPPFCFCQLSFPPKNVFFFPAITLPICNQLSFSFSCVPYFKQLCLLFAQLSPLSSATRPSTSFPSLFIQSGRPTPISSLWLPILSNRPIQPVLGLMKRKKIRRKKKIKQNKKTKENVPPLRGSTICLFTCLVEDDHIYMCVCVCVLFNL